MEMSKKKFSLLKKKQWKFCFSTPMLKAYLSKTDLFNSDRKKKLTNCLTGTCVQQYDILNSEVSHWTEICHVGGNVDYFKSLIYHRSEKWKEW